MAEHSGDFASDQLNQVSDGFSFAHADHLLPQACSGGLASRVAHTGADEAVEHRG